MKFTEWLAVTLGTSRWVVAARLSRRLVVKGYVLAVSERRFDALEAEFIAAAGSIHGRK